MTLQELYQPITDIFSPEEMQILQNLCEAAAKKADEYARKAGDAERAVDMQREADHMQHAEDLRQLAEDLRNEETKVEDLKEEWIGEVLLKEINSRMNLCKRERYEMYNQLALKITDLIF